MVRREGDSRGRVLLGDAGPHPEAAGVLETRVGYSGGDVPTPPTATTALTRRRSRSSRSRADVVPRRARVLLSVHDPTTLNRQGTTSGELPLGDLLPRRGAAQRRGGHVADVEASGLWPGKVRPEIEPAGPSGRPSPSTRTTSRSIPTATRAISRGLAGSSLAARRQPPARAHLRRARSVPALAVSSAVGKASGGRPGSAGRF